MSVHEMLKKNIGLPQHFRNLTQEEMIRQITSIKKTMGDRLYIPCHHYQKDEVIQFADDTGDSLKLAQLSCENKQAEYIVFCGVHFMAETADLLSSEKQQVLLPDMRAGCSMADMANIHQTKHAWKELQQIFGNTIMPLTYVNSTASIKSFVGKHGGATVTSSNALTIVKWALEQKKRILFLPDQHLGRNTSYELGIPHENMTVWDPIKGKMEDTDALNSINVILWKGHCSVHEKFTLANIKDVRDKMPNVRVLVHPECTFDVVQASDASGSTKYIIDTIETAPAGSTWAIGTEMNLVNRLITNHPTKTIVSLNPNMCPCLTMNRIDLPHLLWALTSIIEGNTINTIKVSGETAYFAKVALNRMLQYSSF